MLKFKQEITGSRRINIILFVLYCNYIRINAYQCALTIQLVQMIKKYLSLTAIVSVCIGSIAAHRRGSMAAHRPRASRSGEGEDREVEEKEGKDEEDGEVDKPGERAHPSRCWYSIKRPAQAKSS